MADYRNLQEAIDAGITNMTEEDGGSYNQFGFGCPSGFNVNYLRLNKRGFSLARNNDLVEHGSTTPIGFYYVREPVNNDHWVEFYFMGSDYISYRQVGHFYTES